VMGKAKNGRRKNFTAPNKGGVPNQTFRVHTKNHKKKIEEIHNDQSQIEVGVNDYNQKFLLILGSFVGLCPVHVMDM
jgi:hypothetical protein